MRSYKLQPATAWLCAAPVLLLCALSARADVIVGEGAQIFDQTPNFGDFVLVLNGPVTETGDYSVPEAGFVRLLHWFNDAQLTVDDGSTLRAGFGLFTTTFDLGFKSTVLVDGLGSNMQLGSPTYRTGTIRLNGSGDFDITGGGVVNWIEPNSCDGSFGTCEVLIGATSDSNTGIRVLGAGSLLDASNTNGRFWVGFDPSTNPYNDVDPLDGGPPDSEDFFVIADGGTVRSNGGGIGKGFEAQSEEDEWTAADVGFVHGTAFIDNGSWYLVPGDIEDDIGLNIGEGDGGSGNLIVVNGGLLDITADPGGEAGFFVGQTVDGEITEGGSNLVLIDGPGSTVNVDDNADFVSGSRIANAFVTVQNEGSLLLDSSVLVVSGNSGASLSQFNTDLASRTAGATSLANINLDVLSGSGVAITDTDAQGISALVIGQTPGDAPTESASVRVSGIGSNITVSNDPGLAKIPVSATEFGLPFVSNIGTGSLTIESGGSVSFANGDFVIAARAADDADVFLTDGTLSADRVVVGWSDFEGGIVAAGASSGLLSLNNGVINGDVVVDDNGVLVGEGIINGALFAEGGFIDPGFSPGTITAERVVLGPGSELVMEVALKADGSVDPDGSDAIIATSGAIDLSGGNVVFKLSSADPLVSLEDIVSSGTTVLVTDVFDSAEPVAVASFELTDASGEIAEEDLAQQVLIGGVIFDKSLCKKGGWKSLAKPDGKPFKNQGQCIRYDNTGK